MPSPTIRESELKDLASQAWITVQVVRDVSPAEVNRAERAWKPYRSRLAKKRRAAGHEPEHDHWDWTYKTQPGLRIGWRFVAVKCGSSCEGMMAVRPRQRAGRLVPGPVLYVDFIEVAPWNSRDLTDTPRLGGAGTQLVTEAVAMSIDLGWNGRVGLSALQQAKGFYTRLGMTVVDEGDPDYGELASFEFDEQAVRMLLKKYGGGRQ